MDTVQTKMFQPLSEPAVGVVWVAKDSTVAIGGIVQGLPLKVPPGGTYFVALEGKSLHIYETTSGISRFTTTDPSKIRSIETDESSTKLEVVGVPGVSEVVVHRECGALSHGALQLDELLVPVGAMQQFAALAGKRSLTPSERVRKIELLAEIRGAFLRAESEVQQERAEPARPRERRSTPPSSGEGRSYRTGGTG